MGWFRRQMDPEELERVKTELAQLRQAIDAADQRRAGELAERSPADPRLDALAAKLADLDARVTSVSTELANQVSELGHDIDALAHAPNGHAPPEAVLGELRDGQVRLANEQARYQIAFREDLARLADRLRRP